MTVKVRVSPSLRGELLLPCFNSSFKPNQLLTLSDVDYKSIGVQIALKKGFLVKEETGNETKEKVDNKPEVVIEQTVETVSQVKTVAAEDDPTNMSTWDASKQELLDKEESTKTSMEQRQSIDIPVQTGNIDLFDDKKPKKAKAARKKPKKSARKKKVTKTKKSNKKKKLQKIVQELADTVKEQKKSIEPVGVRKEEPVAGQDGAMYANESNDLSFVDQEQEIDRIERHPVLSKKRDNQAGMNEEVK